MVVGLNLVQTAIDPSLHCAPLNDWLAPIRLTVWRS
jgi:hypothetical protein